MEHRLIFTVIAKECDVFAEVHILEVIGDKASVATLDALAKIFQDVGFGFHLFDDTSLRRLDKVGQNFDLAAVGDLGPNAFERLARV